MLCSSCHELIQPVVALDIDGTLGDYHSHFLDFAVDWIGWDAVPDPNWYEGYDGSVDFSMFCCDLFRIDLATYRDIKLAYRQGGMKRTMPINTGAQALAWSIKDAGAELWITTTRPYLSLDNIVPDTVEWLRRHMIDYDGMLFDEEKYKQLADRVDKRRVVLILDDLREMCEAASELFNGVAVQVATPFNYGDRYTVSSTLDAAADIALGKIRMWREQNDGNE
jgi:hypothetical protein